MAKVQLRPESDDDLDEWRKKLKTEDGKTKKSLLSIRVAAEGDEEVEEVKYRGQDNSNVFLAEEGEWFELSRPMCNCYKRGLINAPCGGAGTSIQEKHYKTTSKELGVEKAVLKAIAKQESKRKSFWKEGQATILFEPRKMWKYLRIDAGKTMAELKKLKQQYPNVVNNQHKKYGSYEQQYKKLKKAKGIDYRSAIKSASWGRFQVMGFNYAVAFDSPEKMEKAVNQCELQQFEFFIGFVENKQGLTAAMKNKDWELIAEKYNGSRWKEYNPNYAKHLEKYYNELK